MVAMAFHRDRAGKLAYFEYPYLPIKSLIRRGEEVKIVSWRMRPTQWDRDWNILEFGEVSFRFLHPNCGEEICSRSTAKRVVKKFRKLLDQLASSYCTETLEDGSVEITVEGDVRAKFFKSGRFFDLGFYLATVE
jgi:hypothetical protein